MELRDLRYFVALADERHFTKAAAALGIAQPTLSRQIMKLEAELGAELFHRTKRSVALTPAGRAVLDEARLVPRQADTTFEVARQAAAGKGGDLHIGFIEIAAFSVLPRIVAAYRRANPTGTVRVTELTTMEQAAALRAHSIDVGIMRAPITGEVIDWRSVARESVAVVLPSSHRLAKRAHIKLGDLRKEPFIFHSSERATRLSDEIAASARQRGFAPRVSQVAGRLPYDLQPRCGRPWHLRRALFRAGHQERRNHLPEAGRSRGAHRVLRRMVARYAQPQRACVCRSVIEPPVARRWSVASALHCAGLHCPGGAIRAPTLSISLIPANPIPVSRPEPHLRRKRPCAAFR